MSVVFSPECAILRRWTAGLVCFDSEFLDGDWLCVDDLLIIGTLDSTTLNPPSFVELLSTLNELGSLSVDEVVRFIAFESSMEVDSSFGCNNDVPSAELHLFNSFVPPSVVRLFANLNDLLDRIDLLRINGSNTGAAGSATDMEGTAGSGLFGGADIGGESEC